MNRQPDHFRQQLAGQFRRAVFGPAGIPGDIDEEMILDLFRAYCERMYYSGSPGFRRLITRVADECEAELSRDHALTLRLGPGGKVIREWRRQGQLGPDTAETN